LSEQAQITTIIPTYRRPKLLLMAVLSVLEQTYPNFRNWIYGNDSQNKTAEVAARLAAQDPRVKYHCHKENIGAVANIK